MSEYISECFGSGMTLHETLASVRCSDDMLDVATRYWELLEMEAAIAATHLHFDRLFELEAA